MTYCLHFPPRLRGTIQLPTSKSISARALVIAFLAGRELCVDGLSDCDDTQAMLAALRGETSAVDIGPAGTAMRFLTAVFSVTPGERLLTGSQRMLHRPIRLLVEALQHLGADIEYEGEEGYPPLRIRGRRLEGGMLSLPADVSSQYVSALLMVAPCLRKGLRLRLTGHIASRPYIDMTLRLMEAFGAEARWTAADSIEVKAKPYDCQTPFRVESDWSAASYWYEMVALSPDRQARIELPGLRFSGLQGDSAVSGLFRPLGVETTETSAGVVLTKAADGSPAGFPYEVDFSRTPDLAQTLVCTCVLLGVPFRFTGLESLRIKETDRISALRQELSKMGAQLRVSRQSDLSYDPAVDGAVCSLPPGGVDTYDDHRMAMALAPAALLLPGLCVNHPEVVSKSYPHFWRDLEQLGTTLC